MRNLLDSTAIGTLFLDDQLRVRRFTAQMTQIIRLIDSYVGRPITDLATTLSYPALPDDARAVVATLVVKETQAEAVDGRWYSVRIMPYRTVDDRVDGVVITFTDVTRARILESTLRLRQEDP
jgi:two-component system CheB/CheR fusion protein